VKYNYKYKHKMKTLTKSLLRVFAEQRLREYISVTATLKLNVF